MKSYAVTVPLSVGLQGRSVRDLLIERAIRYPRLKARFALVETPEVGSPASTVAPSVLEATLHLMADDEDDAVSKCRYWLGKLATARRPRLRWRDPETAFANVRVEPWRDE